MIQNKKVQDLFPEGTKVTITLNGEEGTYRGVVDFSDLVGVSLKDSDYELGGFTTGPAKALTFMPYSAIKTIRAVGDN